MSFVSDPSRLNRHHGRDEGGKKDGFEVETVQHGRTLSGWPRRRPPRTHLGPLAKARFWAQFPLLSSPRKRGRQRKDGCSMASMINLSWLPPIFAHASERLANNLGELAGGAPGWVAGNRRGAPGQHAF